MNWLDLTGEAEQQVKNSLAKAIGAFEWNNDEHNINLIVMEADGYEDIDISQARFITENINLYIIFLLFNFLRRIVFDNFTFN
ncbi:hypothetical protein V7087_17440 [Neobacillus niacini]|uniref:hypothetical protein n=1 Tax=Neobacillus niacini TaxID=86668 RepID=UPI002FFFD1AA